MAITKKYFLVIPILALMTICLFVLSACGNNPTLDTKFDIKNQSDTIVNKLVSDCYNASILGKGTTYSVSQIKDKISNFNYYVEIGTIKNISDVKSISLGNLKFTKAQEFDLSIGNNNKIKDKVFYVENEKVYVAAPIIAFETINNAKIKINDNTFDLNLNNTASALEFNKVAFQNGSTNTISKKSNSEYDISLNNFTTWLGFYFEGATQNDVILTRKILNGNLNGYGLTATENATDYPLAFYPAGYHANPNDVSADYNNATMNYSAYIVNKGIANVRLNYTLETIK